MNKKTERILDTTTRLFVREGIKKITMDDIAENARASKVTLYKYFVDKDTLYYEVGSRICADYSQRLNDVVRSGTALVKKLYAFLDVIGDFADSGKFALCEELAAYNSAVNDAHEAYLQTYRDSILALLDDGVQTGLIKDGLDREMMFHYIDMGVVYYRQNAEYRNKMLADGRFRRDFLLFYISNIFIDGEEVLPYK